MLKEGGGPLCSLDCDPSSRSLSLKVSAQGTNEPLGQERSNPCCPGVMAVPGFSPFFFIIFFFFAYHPVYKRLRLRLKPFAKAKVGAL